MDTKLVVVRGGGDIATGTIYKLFQSGFSVVVLEIEKPSTIRCLAAFSQAIYQERCTVEGVSCRKATTWQQAKKWMTQGEIPILVDPQAELLKKIKPFVLVDAILAKKNLGTNRLMAPITVALGPGFEAGKDVDVVIETMRGHHLGRVITSGFAIPDTKIPGEIGGYTKERVIYAPVSGVLKAEKQIADIVNKDDLIAMIEDTPVLASISGVLRGLICPGYQVKAGLKIADIDPRIAEQENCYTISDKARCIAGGVLEAILSQTERIKNGTNQS